MRHFFTLLRHEVRALLISPATYIAAVLFLGLMGTVFQLILVAFVREESSASPATDFFQLFWLPVLFLTPLLTMRSLAEEKRLGTIETLMTAPVTSGEVILAKFAAAYLFYVALWLSTASFHWVLFHFADDPRVIDPGPLLGGYAFVSLSGLMFIGTGIFASATTRSQLVAALLALVLVSVEIFGSRLLADWEWIRAEPNPFVTAAIEHVQVFQHAEDFAAGVVDTRAPVFYVSVAGLMLFLSMLALDARSSRS